MPIVKLNKRNKTNTSGLDWRNYLKFWGFENPVIIAKDTYFVSKLGEMLPSITIEKERTTL